MTSEAVRSLGALVRKSWLETRPRFIGSAIILCALGFSTVVRSPTTISGWEHFHAGEKMPYALYVWLSLSHGYLQFIWIICAIILGLGGLLREQSLGSVGLTLSLPSSRRRLVFARAIVGASEAALLAFIPELLVSALSPLAGQSYSPGQALLFGSVMVGGGMIFYALAFFASHLLQSEYAAPSVALALTASYYVLSKLPHLSVINVFELMSGARYMDSTTYVFTREYPLGPVFVSLVSAAALIGLSCAWVRRRDF